MLSPLPRWNRKVHLSLSSFAISAFPEIMAGRLPHHVFRGLLSVHSRYGLHTHQVTFMTLYTGGFSRFVTSTTAPIATGWNESCRAGFAPAGKPCLCTAHMIWARMLAYITGTVDQELLLRNEYLAAENRILRAQIKGRLLLSDGEKATLAEIAHRVVLQVSNADKFVAERLSCVLRLPNRKGCR